MTVIWMKFGLSKKEKKRGLKYYITKEDLLASVFSMLVAIVRCIEVNILPIPTK